MTRISELEYAEILCRRPAKRGTAPLPAPAKPNKYRNKKTEVDGIVFDSKREATRYLDLKYMQQAGIISDLQRQVLYPLIINGQRVGNYRCDFEYIEKGNKIVEDTKGCHTPMYRLKKKLMRAIYGIEIRET